MDSHKSGVTRGEIGLTQERIAEYVRRTPLIEAASPVFAAPPLSLKLEFLQRTGSFKPRGAFNNLLTRPAPPVGCPPHRAEITAPRSPTPRESSAFPRGSSCPKSLRR
jgi:hypothetical protein